MTARAPDGFFLSSLERFSGRSCLLVPGSAALTYRELLARADALAGELGPDRKLVFIEGRRCAASVAAYVGCLRAGHVVHLIDPEKESANESLVAKFEPNVVIRCGGFDSTIDPVHDGIVKLHPELAVLLTTSGSTGAQRLVKLSYANVQSNTEAIIEYLEMTEDDRAISALNLHYSFGLSILNSHLATGGSIVLTDLSIRDGQFWALVASERVTSFSGVPYSFELLDQLGIELGRYPALRVVTQAGGRLAPKLVRKFARLGSEQGWKFYVMYGQTEASPRMAYLPPSLAYDNPDCIGVAIPGGRFQIAAEDGRLSEEAELEGELVYSGPNVMIGYASSRADLETKETIPELFTGDLAVKSPNGLFRIVGRKARFVKPLGIRVSLDDLETSLSGSSLRSAAIGLEESIVIFVEQLPSDPDLLGKLAGEFGLPESTFQWRVVPRIPVLGAGKTDYKSLERLAREGSDWRRSGAVPIARRFLREAAAEFREILIGGANRWSSVLEIFQAYFPAERLSPDQSFVSLGGDSLLYVEVGICLGEILADVPDAWHEKSIEELQALIDLPAT
jgi:acyl-CoA synthetase (AMP-forming)/AMP-acid ligase II